MDTPSWNCYLFSMNSLNKNEQYDVTIVGNGIASKIFLFFYLQDFPDSKVSVIESPLYPSCSIKTTSHVAVSKRVEGSGVLGQLVVESFEAFESFVKENSPYGIETGQHYLNTFDDGALHYFITPKLFFQWIQKELSSYDIHYFSDHIISVQEADDLVKLQGDVIHQSKKVLIASGPGFSSIKINGFTQDFYKGFVKRPGSYWISKAGNYHSDNSWVYTKGKANLIYRREEHLFLLGGTTNADHELGIDFSTLIEWHQLYQNELVFLPQFSSGEVDSGIRFRGPKRLPFSGKVPGTKQLFALTGMHKNGFSYPFLLAKKCLEEFVGD